MEPGHTYVPVDHDEDDELAAQQVASPNQNGGSGGVQEEDAAMNESYDEKQEMIPSNQVNNQDLDHHHSEDGIDTTTYEDDSGCMKGCLDCLGQIPYPSLCGCVILLLGIGSWCGGIMTSYDLVNDMITALNFEITMLWYYVVIGVGCGMFLFGAVLLLVAFLSSGRTKRKVFRSRNKNLCGRVLNGAMLFWTLFFALLWFILAIAFFLPPMFLYIYDNKYCDDLTATSTSTSSSPTPSLSTAKMSGENTSTSMEKGATCIDMFVGSKGEKICSGGDLEKFCQLLPEAFIRLCITLGGCLLIGFSMIWLLICIAANFTHLSHDGMKYLFEDEDVGQNSIIQDSKI